MKRKCERCGVLFTAYKNRRYCDACDELFDHNLSTVLMEGYEEKFEHGILKSKKVGYCYVEKNSMYFNQTKFAGVEPITLENPEMVKALFNNFRKKLLKSRKKTNNKAKNINKNSKPKVTGLILKHNRMYQIQIQEGKEKLVEHSGDFFYPPAPKEYPVYKTGCIVCKNIFLTFSNKAKYCPDCRLDKHLERTRKYQKLRKNLFHVTTSELENRVEHEEIYKNIYINPDDYYLGPEKGTGSLGPHPDPDVKKEIQKVRNELKRVKLRNKQ